MSLSHIEMGDVSATGKVPVIGLIGGVGSGKSSIARRLEERHRIVVVDADVIGHDVLRLADVREKLRKRFPNSFADGCEDVERSALARQIFGDSREHEAARQALEAIVHPEIGKIIRQQVKEATARKDIEAVILDAAVLLEAGWQDVCDRVIFVDVPYEERLRRAMKRRGWTEDEFRAREASQLSIETKQQLASDTIANTRADIGRAGVELEKIITQLTNEPL